MIGGNGAIQLVGIPMQQNCDVATFASNVSGLQHHASSCNGPHPPSPGSCSAMC